MKKIFIDTDIGDDIDDALALAYALKSPNLHLLGVSTVFKNVAARRQLVMRLLRSFGKQDIPVAMGVGMPLNAAADVTAPPTYWRASDEPIPVNCTLSGPELMIQTVRAHPDVTLLAIGPLTNLAIAARLAPEVCRAKVMLMGGMYGMAYPEWNIACDPEAADIVFTAYRDITMVGLDVTLKCRLTENEVRRIARLSHPEAALLSDWIAQWNAASHHLPILHDPLVVAACEYPELLCCEAKRMIIERSGALTRGITVDKGDPFFDTPQQTNALVATRVDAEKFKQLFLARVFPEE